MIHNDIISSESLLLFDACAFGISNIQRWYAFVCTQIIRLLEAWISDTVGIVSYG